MANHSSVTVEDERCRLGMLVMQLSLACWREATNGDRTSLAFESRLWNVYEDAGGYLRTQTLDRYLSETSFPCRPRWNRIYATARYVLSTCGQSSHLCDELQLAMNRLGRDIC
nr:hypothetical protein [uncultured Desulfuromonas sp.]